MKMTYWTDSHVFTAAVGSYAPNAHGLYDMHGNVSEWCADWYDSAYYQHSDTIDPQGPATGTHRVQRGGSFFQLLSKCRSAARASGPPDQARSALGFRIVKESR